MADGGALPTPRPDDEVARELLHSPEVQIALSESIEQTRLELEATLRGEGAYYTFRSTVTFPGHEPIVNEHNIGYFAEVPVVSEEQIGHGLWKFDNYAVVGRDWVERAYASYLGANQTK